MTVSADISRRAPFPSYNHPSMISVMKKIIIVLLSMLLVGAVAPTVAKTSRTKAKSRASKKRKSAPKGYVHLHFDPWLAVNPVTAADLGLKGPVESVTCIFPIYDGQYEAGEGATMTLTFDRQGRLVVYDYFNFGDTGGHDKFIYHYDADGRIVRVEADCMMPTQDYCQEDQSIISDYTFSYKDGRLAGMTELTKSVWGKPVNWPVAHFNVTYGADGNLKEVKCIERPNVYFQYSGDKVRRNNYYNEQNFSNNGRCTSKWTYYSDPSYEPCFQNPTSLPDISGKQVNIISDGYGNWTKCYWTVDGYGAPYEDGEFRRITYFK